QQYRSNNSISPKPATKRFLIFRIEPLIFIDELPAHRNPSISPPGEDGGGVSATSEALCEAVHIIERGMAGPLLARRRRRARTFKEGRLRQNKSPDRAGFFVRRYSLMKHPIGRGGDATVIATLPHSPAEIIDAYSQKLSRQSLK